MTVLFADVVRSMDMAAMLGPERLREVMATLFDRAGAVVRRYGGTVDKFTGDGLMALFGAPLALENHALQACRAALEIQAAVRDEVDVQLRIGLNSGEVVAGEIGSGAGAYTAIGEQVGMAQRMESAAPPNGVMLSESTARLVEADTRLGPIELVTVKGRSEPVEARRLYTIVDRAQAAGRVDIPLRGRRWEMAAVRGLLDDAVDGRGSVLGVAGPPGIGKSRLTREIAALAVEREAEVVTAYCESHTSAVPFHLASQLLRAAFGVSGLAPLAARELIREQLPDASAEDLLLLDDLVGVADPDAPLPPIDPDARRRRLSALLNTASLAREHPVVFVVEDAHWIDEVSESLVLDFLPVVPHTRTLFVITYRPEYRGPLATVPGGQTVALAPLNDSDTGSLVTGLLGTHPSVHELGTAIAERTAGNPFFAEEIVRELSQRGVLDGERGDYRTSLTINEIRVPATLQAAIASRIDRLSPSAKRTLGAASVIGSRFDPELLRGLETDAEVDELLDAQLIDQVQFTPSAVYAFHHPLIRTVAYESQLISSRSALHRRLAQVIEDRGRPDEDAALIGEHLEAAGDLRTAYEWHMRAGAWANYRSITAAHTSWQRAAVIADRLAAAGESDATALRIAPRTLVCGSAWRQGSGAETGFDELRRLCETAGDRVSLALGMTGQSATLFARGNSRAASLMVDELFELLGTVNDPALTVAVAPMAMSFKLDVGDIAGMAPFAEMAMAAAGVDPDREDLIVPGGLAATFVLRANMRGWLGESGWQEDIAAALSRCTDGALSQAGLHGYAYIGSIPYGLLAPHQEMARRTEEILSLAERTGDNMSLNMARCTHGIVLLYQPDGDSDRGLELLEQVRDDALSGNYSHAALPLLDALLARSDAGSGRYDEAIRRLEPLVDDLMSNQRLVWLPFVVSTLVEALLQRGDSVDVDAALEMTARLAAIPAFDDLVTPKVTLLRLRALIARARGDDAAYREHRDRYREMANTLGFEGHMEWAAALP